MCFLIPSPPPPVRDLIFLLVINKRRDCFCPYERGPARLPCSAHSRAAVFVFASHFITLFHSDVRWRVTHFFLRPCISYAFS